ncbi:MAG: hypothetical protein NVSMB62_27030 [Acidobacteriaceae bacterium]
MPIEGRWRAWGEGFGGTVKFDGTPQGSRGITTKAVGGQLGLEYIFRPGDLLGLSVSQGRAEFNSSDNATRGSVDATQVALYGLKHWGDFYTYGTIGYAHFTNGLGRDILGATVPINTTARFGSDQFTTSVELGKRFGTAMGGFTPFVGVDYALVRQPDYTESVFGAGANGDAGLIFKSAEVSTLASSFGGKVDASYRLGGNVFNPYFKAAWVHQWLDDPSFTIEGPQTLSFTSTVAPRDTAKLEGGATIRFPNRWSLSASVIGQFGTHFEGYFGKGTLRYTW